MENASKALLITSAILIVIILISLGVKIFSSTSDAHKAGVRAGTTIGETAKAAADNASKKIIGTQIESGVSSNPHDTSTTVIESDPTTEDPTQSGGSISTISNGIGQSIQPSNYGDYIDFGQSVVGNSNLTSDDWRILYNDKSGYVYAILADYLPNNNIAVTASEINLVDNSTYCVRSTIGRQDLLDKLNNTIAWQSLIPSALVNKGAKVKGGIAADIILASYNEKYNINPAKDLLTSTYFYINNDSSKGVDTLYMPQNIPGYAYWLASPYNSPFSDSYLWIITCTGNLNDGAYNHPNILLRPVVCLSSNIQVTCTISNGKKVWSIVE